jgi:hypothetical protein
VRPGCFFIEKGGILVNHVDTMQDDVAQNQAKPPMKPAKGAKQTVLTVPKIVEGPKSNFNDSCMVKNELLP